MSTRSETNTPAESPTSPPSSSGRWKALTAVLAVVTLGLGIWVAVLYQDSRDSEDAAAAEIASLEDDRAQLQDDVAQLEEENATLALQKQQLAQDARQALRQAVAALAVTGERLQVSEQQVAEATSALDQSNQALQQASGELARARAARDVARAVVENARVCAGGALAAVSAIADDDVDGAVEALEVVAEPCDLAYGAP